MFETAILFKEQMKLDVEYTKQTISDIDNGLLSHYPNYFVNDLRRQMVNSINNPNLIYNIK